MIQSNLFQSQENANWETTSPGVQRQILGYDDKLMLVKVKFDKGGVGELHSHPHAQASYVESGIFEMTIGDTKKKIKKGDGYYVPPYTVHGCVCIEEGVLIDSFSPMRWDFIQTDSEKYAL